MRKTKYSSSSGPTFTTRVMDSRLLEACTNGDVKALEDLIRQAPMILRRAVMCCEESPLHVAVLCGHVSLVRALLRLQPELASERDASGCAPLHLASAKGSFEIVHELLEADAELGSAPDNCGRTPLHLAVMKGRLEVVREFIRVCPRSASERLDRGETVLHLAVKYCRLDVLKLVVEELRDDGRRQLLVATDDGGNTVLHFAAFFKQIETVRYLLSLEEVKAIANQPNKYAHTAMDHVMDSSTFEIMERLTGAGVRRGRDQPFNPAIVLQSPATNSARTRTGLTWEIKKLYHHTKDYLYKECNMDWIPDVHGSLMVVATVIVSIAYQAGMNPPGGVWQADTTNSQSHACTSPDSCRAGTAVFKDAKWFDNFYTSNTRAMVAALGVVLLHFAGLPLKNKVSIWLMTLATCVMLHNVMWAYLASTAMVVNPEREKQTMRYACVVWSVMVLIITVIHTVRIVYWLTLDKLKLFARPEGVPARLVMAVIYMVAVLFAMFVGYKVIDRSTAFSLFK